MYPPPSRLINARRNEISIPTNLTVKKCHARSFAHSRVITRKPKEGQETVTLIQSAVFLEAKKFNNKIIFSSCAGS